MRSVRALHLFLSCLMATSSGNGGGRSNSVVTATNDSDATHEAEPADTTPPPPAPEATPAPLTFTALTKPLPIYPGEVSNDFHLIDIPAGPIAISEFVADIVEKDEAGNLIPVSLSEAYLHHHIVFAADALDDDNDGDGNSITESGDGDRFDDAESPNKLNERFGFGAGSESRFTPQIFPSPYRFTTRQGEDQLVANVHVINTRTMTKKEAHLCLECPCTKEDYDQDTNALTQQVLDRNENWGGCNAQLLGETNPACFPSLYHGGLYCCEHGEFCLDQYYLDPSNLYAPDNETKLREANPEINETQSVFYLRYSLTYEPLANANEDENRQVKPLYFADCCDATGNMTHPGNIEYDIPKLCSKGGSCVHSLETVQALSGGGNRVYEIGSSEEEVDKWVDVVFMVGHLHIGGIELSAFLANAHQGSNDVGDEHDGSDTNGNETLLCRSLPKYGTGKIGEIGNEPGYINAMSTCTFDPPLRMKTTDKIHVVAKYDASKAHTGVMSLFYIAIADVDSTVTTVIESVIEEDMTRIGAYWHSYRGEIIGVVVVISIVTFLIVRRQRLRHEGYEPVGNSMA